MYLAQDLLEDAEEINGGIECGYRLLIEWEGGCKIECLENEVEEKKEKPRGD